MGSLRRARLDPLRQRRGLGLAATLGTASLLLPACATKRPVLYPNGTFQQVGAAQAQEDIDTCLEFAAEHGLEANPTLRTAGSTAKGATYGGAGGAAWGAIWGRAGRRAAAGAAGGAAVGLLHGVFSWREPDPIQARFVDRCLSDQGYSVIGWK